MADYFTDVYGDRMSDFNPFPTFVAGIVLGSLFGSIALCCGVRWVYLEYYLR